MSVGEVRTTEQKREETTMHDEIRKAADAATDGPWDALWFGDRNDATCGYMPLACDSAPNHRGLFLEAPTMSYVGDESVSFGGSHGFTNDDARFIAHARQWVPELLGELDAQAAELTKLRSRIVTVDIDGREVMVDNVAEAEAALASVEADNERLEDELRIANERGDAWRERVKEDTHRIEQLTSALAAFVEVSIESSVKVDDDTPARCGKYVARADHGDLSDLLTELDGDLSERLRMMAEERRRVEADSRNIVLP